MPVFATENEWKDAKKLFETATNKKRPKKSFLIFWKKGSGIEPALKECDKLANTPGTTGAKLRAATEKLRKAVNGYMKQLDDQIDKEGQSETGEDIKSDLYRHLKVLKTTAIKFVDQFEYEAQQVEQLEKSNNMADLANKTALANLKKSLSGAAAAIQAIKADPSPEMYNKHLEKSKGEVGRKLATSLKAVMGAGVDWDVQKHITSLDAFSTGDKMAVKLTTSKEDILSLLKEFSTKVKAVAADAGM